MLTEDKSKVSHKGPIAWMAGHPNAANLLMAICLIGGLLILSNSTKEVFPEFTLDTISISMAYPGASSEEVEQGIVLSIENELADIEGLGEITSSASEGLGRVTVEVLDESEIIRIAQDIKSATDRITTFPVNAEDLTVSVNSRRRDVLSVAVYGSANENTLRSAAEAVRNKLEEDPNIGPVELTGVREYEIHIEISQDDLRRYNITLDEVADKIRRTALELGGGKLETNAGEILIRIDERRDTAFEFKNIPIISLSNGANLLLGDIATIYEGFDDSNNFAFYDNKPAILFDIYRVGKQTPVGVSNAVKNHIEDLNGTLPGDLQLVYFNDRSELFKGRAQLLMKNGLFGLVLVLCLLALFLETKLAFWVGMGIPISFLGAFLFFPATDFTLNIVTMFAFIISLGIVVDDAIISGENIFHYRQLGYSPLDAAIKGAEEIAVPVTFSILSNITAFLPLLFIPGVMGKIFGVIPIVVISIFIVSLIESLFILPAHLNFETTKKSTFAPLQYIGSKRELFNQWFSEFVHNKYKPFITNKIIPYRYTTLSLFIGALIIIFGFAASGRLGMTLFPNLESDFAYASATLKVGSPLNKSQDALDRLVKKAEEVVSENGGDNLSLGIRSSIEENLVEVFVYLTDTKIRPITTTQFSKIWRDKVGDLVGIESLNFQSNRGGPGSGKDLTIELSHPNTDILQKASEDLGAFLKAYPNTLNIDDGSAQGKMQFDLKMKELGFTYNLNTAEVAQQMRSAFYGSEAFKQQRGRNEVRVLVRLPEEQRTSQFYIKNYILQTPTGVEVQLKDVVDIIEGRAFTTINRKNNKRVVQVTADVEPSSATNSIIASIVKDELPFVQNKYPGLTYSFEGGQAEIRDSINTLFIGLLSVIFVIYVFLAILFKSYSQPLMILIAIPFGMVGAVIGHQIMGYNVSVISLFGIVALAGVVVNDSLILVDFANRKRQKGADVITAIVKSGIQRFRPVMLTTVTTFVGLAPMIFETSRQARFLVPMAISLGFGILFATLLTLILIPALYMIIEDFRGIGQDRED